MKYLVLLALLVIVWLLLRQRVRLRRQNQSAPEKPAEDMVPCAHCGVFLPRRDSVAEGERSYCCPEHRQAGRR